MKVGEARKIYGQQLQSYNKKAGEIGKQQEALKAKMKLTPSAKDEMEAQYNALQVDYDAIREKYEEYKTYMDRVMMQWTTDYNRETMEQQSEAAEKAGEDMSKIMAVIRRMMKGDTVPVSDEKKVMEFDRDAYMMAKNMQMMAQLQRKRHKNHKSLWEEEPKERPEDPGEIANDAEVTGIAAPEIVDVDTLVTSDLPETGETEG